MGSDMGPDSGPDGGVAAGLGSGGGAGEVAEPRGESHGPVDPLSGLPSGGAFHGPSGAGSLVGSVASPSSCGGRAIGPGS